MKTNEVKTSSANVKYTFLEEIVVVVLPYQNNYLH